MMEDSSTLVSGGDFDLASSNGAPRTIMYNSSPPDHQPVGLYGWRKRCLYLLVLLLMVIIVVNLGLTVWILVVLDFNINGMGSMVISESGIRLDGMAEFIGPLYTQEISTDQGSPLRLVSQRSIDAVVSNGSSLHIGGSSINMSTQCLSVSHGGGEPLLSVNRERVSVGAGRMEVTGPLGVVLRGPLQANRIESPANQNLQVQSLSGNMELRGGEGVVVQDGVGSSGMDFTSFSDLTITSQNGQIVLNGGTIRMEGLSRPTSTSESADVYGVCVCDGGRLYLVPASDYCTDDRGICIPAP